eukprot:scaffold22320_cov24-Cyclotella_meneghiniana.AAC.1
MASPTMTEEMGHISPTTGSLTFPLQPQLGQDPTSTSVTPPVSSLPPLLPILLSHHRQGRKQISPIRPSRPAVTHQIQPPPLLRSIQQPVMIMEKGSRLFPVDWGV